jgi:hypothetical protein
VLHGALAQFNEDMAAALCAAVNDWWRRIAGAEPRLRRSRCRRTTRRGQRDRALARRFVQVPLLAMEKCCWDAG